MANAANVVVAALERARSALLVALLVIVPAIALTAPDAVFATAPTCEASLRRAEYAAPVRVAEAVEEHIPLGTPLAQTKSMMWVEQELDRQPQTGRVVGASLVLHANDASGPIECGSVRLNATAVGSHGGALEPRASGDYVYFDTRYGDASQDAVRVVLGPRRHMQTARILSRANLPLGVTLLSALLFSIAALRVRGAAEPGPVLAGPEALSPKSPYRDVPFGPRQYGAHAAWASATMHRLRAAQFLTILAACSALCGVALRMTVA